MTKTLRGSDTDQSHFHAMNVSIICCGFQAMPAPLNPKGSGVRVEVGQLSLTYV
jgi:hypothetical protein